MWQIYNTISFEGWWSKNSETLQPTHESKNLSRHRERTNALQLQSCLGQSDLSWVTSDIFYLKGWLVAGHFFAIHSIISKGFQMSETSGRNFLLRLEFHHWSRSFFKETSDGKRFSGAKKPSCSISSSGVQLAYYKIESKFKRNGGWGAM